MWSGRSTEILRVWIGVTLIFLCAGIAVYGCSVAGFDVMDRCPIARLLYVLVFPPVLAAIVYSRKVGGGDGGGGQVQMLRHIPPWMRRSVSIVFGLAMVSFAIALVLGGGGEPVVRGGKYVLMNNNHVLRSLSPREFGRIESYGTLGLSGVVIAFTYTALVLLLGVDRATRIGRAGAGGVGAFSTPASGTLTRTPQYAARSRWAGYASGAIYVVCVALVLAGRPLLGVLCIMAALVSTGLAVRQRLRDRSVSMRNMVGCLSVVPNAFVGAVVAERTAKFLYVVIYAGIGAAAGNRVVVEFPADGPARLSDGSPLNTTVWAAMWLLVQFPVFGIVAIGLTHLVENAAAWWKAGSGTGG